MHLPQILKLYILTPTTMLHIMTYMAKSISYFLSFFAGLVYNNLCFRNLSIKSLHWVSNAEDRPNIKYG